MPAQAPPPAATNANPSAAANAAATNVAISATNLDARRRALLQNFTNRAPRVNTNALALPAFPRPPAATNVTNDPTTNAIPSANVAGQLGPAATGSVPASPTPLATTANPAGLAHIART